MNDPQKTPGFAWSLWIPVILLFLLVSLGWYVRIKLAAENPIEFIPLESVPSTSTQP